MNTDRFKFRAWHKPTRRLFDVWCYTPEYVFENSEVDGVYASPTNPARIEDCILMQCTGIKDRNGKLIYENDLVKEISEEVEEDMLVAFDEDDAMFALVSSTDEYNFSLFYGEDLEIIGNIHENPELLEEYK